MNIRVNKSIIESVVSLFSVNVLNYALGFITFPYLTRVLGVSGFGLLSFAQSFVGYFQLIVAYSFGLTASRDIAISKNDEELGSVFSSVMIAKLFILLCSTIVYFSVIFFVDMFNNERDIYFALYLVLLGDFLFPVWFFQGIEKMRYIAIFSLISRSLSVFMIFLYVRTENDILYAAFFQAIPSIISGLFSLYFLYSNYKYIFINVKYRDVKRRLVEGWRVFYSSIAVNLYGGSNVFFLGCLTDTEMVGYFVGAQKIMLVFKMIIDTISNAMYPHISKLFSKSFTEAIIFIKSMKNKLYILGLAISVFSFAFSDVIIKCVLGIGYDISTSVFRIIIWIPFIVSFTNVFLVQIILPLGKVKYYSSIVSISAVLNLIIIYPFIHFAGGIGVAFAMVITETYVAVASRLKAKEILFSYKY